MSDSVADTQVAVRRAALKNVFGSAGLALMSSFIALGSLMSESGFSLLQVVGFTLFGFALPGQLLAAEMYADGVVLFAIVITVWLVNLRLLPMVIVLLPLLVAEAEEKPRPGRDMLIAHLVAVTSWACFLGTQHQVSRRQRRYYFILVGGMLWLMALAASVTGFYLGKQLPDDMLIALLFLNPAYFLCMMLLSLKGGRHFVAFFGGALLLPLFHQWLPGWDILICGVVAGLGSYYYFEWRRRVGH